ncbi:MAG: C-GCAxxG-C-C family protein [Spirochaetaceae bacterium]
MKKEYSLLIKEAYETGFSYEKAYKGCAQCTFAALQEILELTNPNTDAVCKAATGLSGGMGSQGDGCCGAYSGSILMIGYILGRERSDLEDAEGIRHTTNKIVRDLHSRFIQEYGTVICHGIQRKIFGRPYYLLDEDEQKKFDEAGAHAEKCPHIVGKGVEWTVQTLHEWKLV